MYDDDDDDDDDDDVLTQWTGRSACQWCCGRESTTADTVGEDSGRHAGRPFRSAAGPTRAPATSSPTSRETSSRISDAGEPVIKHHHTPSLHALLVITAAAVVVIIVIIIIIIIIILFSTSGVDKAKTKSTNIT